jgi:hypothetical protein
LIPRQSWQPGSSPRENESIEYGAHLQDRQDASIRGLYLSTLAGVRIRLLFGVFQSVARSGQESLAQGLPWEIPNP